MAALNTGSMPINYSCPPLTDADYLTSSRLASRRPSRQASKSPIGSIGPAFGEHVDEDKLSVDPRRFTPTLHANLVSEILSLRREVENKNLLVESLEEHVAQVKEENTKLHQISSSHAKEKRSLRKEVDALETGTLEAVESIAQERDRAYQSITELKSKLEHSQKKVRDQEEETERTQNFWQQDQEKWDAERRTLERRVHVVEGRLKIVLTEVATQQAITNIQPPRKSTENAYPWSRERPSSRASGRRSAHSHYQDISSNNASSAGSKTLADELNFATSSDNTDSETEPDSPQALPEEIDFPRSFSSQSNRQSVKARKLLGLHVDASEELGNVRDSLSPNAIASFTNTYADAGSSSSAAADPSTPSPPPPPSVPRSSYVDAATQYTPPVLPQNAQQMIEQRLSTITEFDGDSMFDDPTRSRPISANLEKSTTRPVNMVSSACQTIEAPLSPPDTPTQSRPESGELVRRKPMTTAGTQTSANLFTATIGANSTVPTIAVHPVASIANAGLPEESKHPLTELRSIAIQTDAIRTDERLTKLPEHLHPQIILPVSPSSSPVPSPVPSPAPETQEERRLEDSSGLQLQIPNKKAAVRRSILRNSLEAGDDDAAAADMDGEVSDDSFLKKQPIKKTLSKVQNSWQLVASPTDIAADLTDTEELPKFKSVSIKNTKKTEAHLKPNQFFLDKKLPHEPSKANIGRARSPSEPLRNSAHTIPFPVPDRSSSRKFPWLNDDMLESPTRKTGRYVRGNRAPTKRPVVRKSRSEIGERGKGRLRSPSPQQFDVFTDSLANIPPPLPENEITTPNTVSFKHHSRTASTSHTQSLQTQPESVQSDQTTMVDSIAQTMIGEWMFKYVRRRKSFGIPDEPGTGESSVNGGIRHQRWVWVAPYERAVMWSSKQPTSGTALMGKNGRKLVISSVLDVHDESPMPKGAPAASHFGRSILILTPQRALKFTAVSLERHHVWMNALSFLSQGSVDLNDMIANTPTPAPTSSIADASVKSSARTSTRATTRGHRSNQSSVSGSLHRSRVHDSIRIAKGKERPLPGQRFTNSTHNAQQQAPIEHDESLSAEAPSVPRNSGEKHRQSNVSRSQLNSMRSHTSSNKPSLYSLRSRVNDGNVDSGRTSLRLWPAKSQRAVSENNTPVEATHAAAGQSAYVEQENLFEAVGTMRMSAFIQNRSDRQFGKQKFSNLKRSTLGHRTASANDLERHYATDGVKRLNNFDHSQNSTGTTNSRSEPVSSTPPQLPQPSFSPTERNPFEGF